MSLLKSKLVTANMTSKQLMYRCRSNNLFRDESVNSIRFSIAECARESQI